MRFYRDHVEDHVVPALGRIPLTSSQGNQEAVDRLDEQPLPRNNKPQPAA